jgi:hypothetical protein
MIFKQFKRHTVFFAMVISLSLLVAFSTLSSATASENAAVWVPGDSLQGFFSDPDSDAAPSKEALKVGRTFKDFCNRWIGNKNDYSIKNVRTKKAGSGNVKEYSQCGDAYELRVKKAENSHVYVGTLKYIEKVFRTDTGTSGKSKPEAFVVAQEVPVTEFFMYIDGKWRY